MELRFWEQRLQALLKKTISTAKEDCELKKTISTAKEDCELKKTTSTAEEDYGF
jgi:hypothetical protein